MDNIFIKKSHLNGNSVTVISAAAGFTSPEAPILAVFSQKIPVFGIFLNEVSLKKKLKASNRP